MFNPWSYQCEVCVGPIDPRRELRITPREFIKYVECARGAKSKIGKRVEKSGNLLIHKTRFNYLDGKRQIGVACGEYADLGVLQNIKRFILQPDIGFMVDDQTGQSSGAVAVDAIGENARGDGGEGDWGEGDGGKVDAGKNDGSEKDGGENDGGGGEEEEESGDEQTDDSDEDDKEPSELSSPKEKSSPLGGRADVATDDDDVSNESSCSARKKKSPFSGAKTIKRNFLTCSDPFPRQSTRANRDADLDSVNGTLAAIARLLDDRNLVELLGDKFSQTVCLEGKQASSAASGIHSDLYRRQIPRESLLRLLDMPIFNGTNVKNAVQSGKSLLYYLMTYLLANCMRMYVLPGPQLMCFSAILPLHALCSIFELNIEALPRRALVPIEETPYAYLAKSTNVKYMYKFSPNISFMDRRDPVIHDGSIDTCDKLFFTDDEFSDFRINCTLYCRNRNEDYDGDTNNPGFCKGIESHTEIKYNQRTQLMPLLRNRHVFSQNILFRAFVILAVDEPYERAFDMSTRDRTKTLERDLFEQVLDIVHAIDVTRNPDARRRAVKLFGHDNYPFYELYIRHNLHELREILDEGGDFVATPDSVNFSTTVMGSEGADAATASSSSSGEEVYVDRVHKLATVWAPFKESSFANCFSVLDNTIRSMAMVMGDNYTTQFVDRILHVVHTWYPRVFIGVEPFCFPSIVNVLSTAKGSFDDILLLQRNLETKLATTSEFGDLPLALTDLLRPIAAGKLEQNKNYLDNFVFGSKKVPKNSKLAVSTKWTLQNVIYFDGDLYVKDRVVLENCFTVFSFDLFLDVGVTMAIFDQVLGGLNIGRNCTE